MARLMEWPRGWYQMAGGSFWLSSKNLVAQNPFTQRLSVSGPISQFFQAKIQMSTQPDLPDGEHPGWLEIEGFFAEAGGSKGIIRIADFGRRTPQFNREVLGGGRTAWSDGTFWSALPAGWITGTLPPYITTAAAADKGATSVVVKGLPASTARVLRRGDDIEFRANGIPDETPRLHRIIRDMPTNADGEGRVEFRPALRKGLNLGDMAVLDYPMGNFRLIDDNQGIVDRTPPFFGELSFSLIEALI